ncbi:hypothetical protein N7530_005934 [Penicillium desertorum]|uniref:Uncharacterized protein n=1 Tax=Penicillium desertorum TaxID=1303715 RepID=A0A9X0BRT5_9EURO|nr:hypothetical protein N7530_005934 [Penicillium desertorum]
MRIQPITEVCCIKIPYFPDYLTGSLYGQVNAIQIRFCTIPMKQLYNQALKLSNRPRSKQNLHLGLDRTCTSPISTNQVTPRLLHDRILIAWAAKQKPGSLAFPTPVRGSCEVSLHAFSSFGVGLARP